MKTDKEFEEFFRDRFKDFEESPPDDAWKAIKPKIRKGGLSRSKIMGALVVFIVALLTTMVLFVYNPKQINYTKRERIDKTVTTPDKSSNAPLSKPSSDKNVQIHSSSIKEEDRDLLAEKTSAMKGIAKEDDKKPTDSSIEKVNSDEKSKASGFAKRKKEEKALTNSAVLDSFHPEKKKTGKKIAIRLNNVTRKKDHQNREYLETKSLKQDSVVESENLSVGDRAADLTNNSHETLKLSTVRKRQKEISYEETEDITLKTEDHKAKEVRSESLLKPVSSYGMKATNGLTNLMLQFKPVENEATVEKEVAFKEIKNKPDKKTDVARNYKLQLFFSPRYSYRRVTLNKGDEVYVQNVSRNRYFGERLGYEMGLVGSKNVTDRLSLNLGISFVNLNEKLTYNSTEGEVGALKIEEINPNVFNISPVYKSDTITFKSVYYYTGLTFSSSYVYATSGKRTFYVTLGGGINLLVKGTTEKKINGVNQSKVYFPSKKSPLEQMNFKLNFGPGYAYRISSKAELLVEPTINYYLGSTYKKREPLGLRPYTIGLNLGLKF